MLLVSVLVFTSTFIVASGRVRRRSQVKEAVDAILVGSLPARISDRTRRGVLMELSERFVEATMPVLAPSARRVIGRGRRDLSSRRWLIRARGLRTLLPFGLTVDELLAGLNDPHPRVRAQAASVATGHTEPAILEALVARLSDPEPFVRFPALDALTRRGGGSAAPIVAALDSVELAPASRSSVPNPVVSDIEGADDVGRPGTSSRPMRPSVRDVGVTDESTLLLLLRGAAASADGALVPSVRRFVEDSRPEIRSAGVTALIAVGGDPNDLLPALEDRDGRVRAAAAAAIGRSGDRSMAGYLRPAMADRDHGVRQAAAAALATLGPAGALVLRAALTGSDAFAADAAGTALGLPPAREARR